MTEQTKPCDRTGCNYPEGECSGGCIGAEPVSKSDQCCGKCEKPADLPPVHAAIDPEQPTATPAQYMAAINDLAQRLQTADMLITAFLLKAGGEVVITAEDCENVSKHMITNDPAPDGSGFTFRAVPVPQPTEQ